MSKISVTDYLFQEIKKLGINDIFGLPGDYNFNVLYSIKNQGLNWIGCTNELNAGYAADGYARVNGYGALVTTYGVGELSALNATAGSYAEDVPVIHIVGAPASRFSKQNKLIHHNFLQTDYKACQKMFETVTATTAFLDELNAKAEIDRVLSVFVNYKKPVYISIPVDVCKMEIENEPKRELLKTNKSNLKAAVEHALRLINKSEKPMILGDVLIKRFKAKKEFTNLIEKTKIPASNLLMGKGIIEADNPQYLGTFLGEFENVNVYDSLNASDCVISVGVINCDLNTYRGGLPFLPEDYVDIETVYTVIEHRKYTDILMKDMLNALTEQLVARDIAMPVKIQSYVQQQQADDTKINNAYVYPRIQEFLKPNDMVFVETGIIPHGFAPTRLKSNTEINTQTLWGSIGWATPACLGGAVAARDRRAILLTGEGSHQLTACDLSTMLRYGVKPIIILFNNSGYTIERILSDSPDDFFNDIASWDYSKLIQAFKGDAFVAQARTNKEFDEALNKAQVAQENKLCYIEVFTEKMDLPKISQQIALSVKQAHEAFAKGEGN